MRSVVVVFAILTAEVHHEAEAEEEEEEGVSVACFDSCSETVRVSSRDVNKPRLRLEHRSSAREKIQGKRGEGRGECEVLLEVH